MHDFQQLARQHAEITRRYFLRLGAAGVAGLSASPLWAQEGGSEAVLAEAIGKLEYLTRPERFRMAGRGSPPPDEWGGGLPEGKLPAVPRQIDPATGRPLLWPLRDTIVHWAVLVSDIGPGRYDLRCRSIDAAGIAQPMPRPFPKSGHNAIQRVGLVVEG